ncbi:MAG: AIR synthase-related protein, partial [Boseongicola sp.]
VKGMAHITGGGITENLPRVLPEGLGASVDLTSWKLPAVFDWLGKSGGLDSPEILKTFNAGIGLIIVTKADAASGLAEFLADKGERVVQIGTVTETPGIKYDGELG